MKILHINTNDISGGAAIATHRLHVGLQNKGIDSKMLVKNKSSDEYSVIGPVGKFQKIYSQIISFLDKLPLILSKTNNTSLHSLGFFSSINLKIIKEQNPDIINLHWICDGFVSPYDIRKMNKPIVWTLHDMWAFSGTEHYIGEDLRYQTGYNKGSRPKDEKGIDLNRWTWKRKIKTLANLKNITIITPSNWLAHCASKSILFKNFRIKVIPNGLDTSIFKPLDKKTCRKILNLDENKKIILFGANSPTSDPRKGFDYLHKTLKKFSLNDLARDTEIIIFGTSKPKSEIFFNISTKYLGKINDDYTLTLIYSAADVFIAPSIEDNLPNTVLESMACGTPAVAFNIGGMSDMIDHKENGYLAKPFDTDDLLQGINFILRDNEKYNHLSINSRKKIEDVFSLDKMTENYITLYKDLM